LLFETITINLKRALPIQLRHLEEKPLFVNNINIDFIGIDKKCEDKIDSIKLEMNFLKEMINNINVLRIDINNSGIDIDIIRYRFERCLLKEIYKGNAGRLLYDVFRFDNWNSAKSSYRKNSNNNNNNNNNNNEFSVINESDYIGNEEDEDDLGIMEYHPLFFGN
jgi:hypothetical protein